MLPREQRPTDYYSKKNLRERKRRSAITTLATEHSTAYDSRTNLAAREQMLRRQAQPRERHQRHALARPCIHSALLPKPPLNVLVSLCACLPLRKTREMGKCDLCTNLLSS